MLLQAQQALEESKGASSLWAQDAVQALVDFYRTQGQSQKLAQWAAPQRRKEDAK